MLPISIKETHCDFYRATLCVSSVSAVARCPSVTLVDCIETAEDIIKLLSRPGSSVILVFLTTRAVTQFQGEPLQRGRKIQGVGEFVDFRQKPLSISETKRDRPIVAMKR